MKIKTKCSYEFVKEYTLDIKDSVIYKSLLEKDFLSNKKINYKINNVLQVETEDNGDVRMSHVENIDDYITA